MGPASRNPSISCYLAHGCKHRCCPVRADSSCEFALAGSCARFARLGALRPPCSCGFLMRVLAGDLKWGVCTFGRPCGHLFVRVPHASSGQRSQVRSLHVWTPLRPSVCANLSREFADAVSCARFARLGALRPPCSCGFLTRVLAGDLRWGVCTFGRVSAICSCGFLTRVCRRRLVCAFHTFMDSRRVGRDAAASIFNFLRKMTTYGHVPTRSGGIGRVSVN